MKIRILGLDVQVLHKRKIWTPRFYTRGKHGRPDFTQGENMDVQVFLDDHVFGKKRPIVHDPDNTTTRDNLSIVSIRCLERKRKAIDNFRNYNLM